MEDAKTKWIIVSISGFMSWLSSMPPDIRTLQFLLPWFWGIDMASAWVLAALNGRLSSYRMRSGLSKIGVYLLLAVLAGGAGIIWKTWALLHFVYGAVLACEGTSIIGNIVGVIKVSKMPMYGAQRIINVLAAMYDTTEGIGEQTVFAQTTVVSKNRDEPIISTSNVTTNIDHPRKDSNKG